MNLIKHTQILVARTGVFFANCDGEYDKLEDKFISEFILQMIKDGIEIEDSLKELIDIKSEKSSIDDVINFTKEFLSQVNEDERHQVVDMLKDFIEHVINADGVIHPNEEKYFNQWKDEFCKQVILLSTQRKTLVNQRIILINERFVFCILRFKSILFCDMF